MRRIYEKYAENSKKPALPFEQALTSEQDEDVMKYTENYMERLQATKVESPSGHLFVNGKYVPMAGVSRDAFCFFGSSADRA